MVIIINYNRDGLINKINKLFISKKKKYLIKI